MHQVHHSRLFFLTKLAHNRGNVEEAGNFTSLSGAQPGSVILIAAYMGETVANNASIRHEGTFLGRIWGRRVSRAVNTKEARVAKISTISQICSSKLK